MRRIIFIPPTNWAKAHTVSDSIEIHWLKPACRAKPIAPAGRPMAIDLENLLFVESNHIPKIFPSIASSFSWWTW
jgi:hypothetical protein